MTRKLGLASLLLTLPIVVHAAGTQAERLVSPALPSFVSGYEAGNSAQTIREEVPRGQTVENWTKMVTTQKFTGLAARATPVQYAQNILGGLFRACPGAKASPIKSLTVAGRPAVRFEVSCPSGTGGQKESFILLAIAGKADMHVKQVAFRGALTAPDLAWGRKYFDAVVLCLPGSEVTACK